MADNVAYNPSGSTLFATKDDGTAHHQKQLAEVLNSGGTVKQLGAIEDEAHTTGDGGVMALTVRKDTAAATAGTDGDYQPPTTDANGKLWVNAGGVTLIAGGEVAHGASNSGNPIQNGSEAIAHGTNPTAVSAGQRTKNYANRAGIPFVIAGHPNVVTIELSFTGAQTDVAIVTISTGLKIVVTQIMAVADNANTAFPQIRVGFGTANTPTTTGVVLTHPGVPAGGGVVRGTGAGMIGVGADNEDLRVTAGAPTGGSIRVLVTYYTIES